MKSSGKQGAHDDRADLSSHADDAGSRQASDAVSEGARLPLHIQISELLTREIHSGLWQDGDRFPPEARFARNLGVAVGTLRKALAELEARGLVIRKQGSGNYVTRNHEAKSIYGFFHLELLRGGGLPTAEILSVDLMARPFFLPVFGARAGGKGASVHSRQKGVHDRAVRFRRLRFLSEQAAALEEIWIDGRHWARIEGQTISDSMFAFYRDCLDFWIGEVEDHVSVGTMPDWSRGKGPFMPDTPCGFVERLSLTGSGLVEEYSRTWFAPDICRYSARWR